MRCLAIRTRQLLLLLLLLCPCCYGKRWSGQKWTRIQPEMQVRLRLVAGNIARCSAMPDGLFLSFLQTGRSRLHEKQNGGNPWRHVNLVLFNYYYFSFTGLCKLKFAFACSSWWWCRMKLSDIIYIGLFAVVFEVLQGCFGFQAGGWYVWCAAARRLLDRFAAVALLGCWIKESRARKLVMMIWEPTRGSFIERVP